VRLRGWVLRSRSSGGILFFRIRDRTGSVQVTARKDALGPERFSAVEHVQIESEPPGFRRHHKRDQRVMHGEGE
jgi:asparaginyl-tRNA synthetase